MAPMMSEVELTADDGMTQPTMNSKANRKDILSKSYAEFSSFRQLQIQRIKLKFLRDCKPLKRPPPSLRIHGASALEDTEKLQLFSELETKLLDAAIKNKINDIKRLAKMCNHVDADKTPLSDKDTTSLNKHFAKKIQFYKSQNSKKWCHWPQKVFHVMQKKKNTTI